ncbi:MAG: PKD domain-containing protein [Candidatus Zixiibacteriota bacterium]
MHQWTMPHSSGGRQCRGSALTFAFLGLVFQAVVVTAAEPDAAVPSANQPLTVDWCRTQQIYDAKNVAKAPTNPDACPTNGTCDIAANRNAWIPAVDQPMTTLRLYFHILRMDDGSSAATTPEMLALQVANLNNDFLPSRIQFEYQWRYVNSTAYRSLADAEMDAMKMAFALAADSQINVFVSYVEGSYSFGTFPWDPDALTSRGGIVMTTGHFQSVQSALAHEVGHCLGLWHTFHGVSEVSQCGSCYEPAGTTIGDVLGDLCQDTDPTPTNYSCSPPPGPDPCSGQSWGPTDVQNIMGYSGDACWTEFSTQQKGRMHCWVDDRLMTWVSGVRFTAVNTFGPAPLSVDFSGISAKVVNAWQWNFGDGNLSSEQNPTHVYGPGQFDVSLSIQATDGDYSAVQSDFVSAYADSMIGPVISVQPSQDIRVDVYARNYLPLRELKIPFAWGGPFGLTYDSANTSGLRTNYFEQQQLISYDPSNKRATYFLRSSSTGALPDLVPGSGPVVSLYFSVPGLLFGGPNMISFDGYLSYLPTFVANTGTYNPVVLAATISKCRPGDVDNNGVGPDISDLSFLVDYLFFSGPTPPVTSQADIDGSGSIDIADLTMLLDFLFHNGSLPGCV